MSFSIAIVGLPNVGKSTLFNTLTKREVPVSPRPFTTINPNVGIVSIPDERLDKIAEIIKPKKTTRATLKFIDVAGLVEKAHKGAGLGNQFLSQIRPCKAIIEVIRVFEDKKVKHVAGEVDPKRDIDIINIELLMKDLESCEKLVKKFKKREDKRFEILKKIKNCLEKEKSIREIELKKEEKEKLKEFQFLTEKPIIYLFNRGQKEKVNIKEIEKKLPSSLSLNLRLEQDLAELSEKEREELETESKIDKVVLACYNALNLITFFTIAGGKEARAWRVKKGTKCSEAGGIIHSDFEKKFIKAEVIPWKKLVRAGSWKKARESGQLKIAGKDYIVKDGDVIEFKI